MRATRYFALYALASVVRCSQPARLLIPRTVRARFASEWARNVGRRDVVDTRPDRRRRGQGWHGASPDASTAFVFFPPEALLHEKSPSRSPLPRRAQVSKHDFDMAVKNAQEALRAKTSSSQAMLQQASSAMRNAVTALSLSEQEVANLRQSVQELKQQRDAAGVSGEAGPATDRERAQLRAAQARLAELSQNFRALQSEVARHRYEQDGTAMPVASSFPLRIDPMLSSKVVCIAQLVMLGYSYGDAENAIDAVRVNDAALAVEWLEARNVAKIRCSRRPSSAPAPSARARDARQTAIGAETTTTTRHVTPRRFRPRAGSVDPRAGPLPPSFDRGCRPRDGRGAHAWRLVARRSNENRPRRERVIRGA